MDKELLAAIRQILKETSGLKGQLSDIREQVKENTDILKAVQHNSEVHKAEIENIKHQIAELTGNKEKLIKMEDDMKNHSHEITFNTGKLKIG